MLCEYCLVNEGIETDATHERVQRPYAPMGICYDCRKQFPPDDLTGEFDNELAGTEELRMPPS